MTMTVKDFALKRIAQLKKDLKLNLFSWDHDRIEAVNRHIQDLEIILKLNDSQHFTGEYTLNGNPIYIPGGSYGHGS